MKATITIQYGLTLLAALVLTDISWAEFIKGVDLSMLQYIQDHDVQYKEAGKVKDPLLIFKDHGCNYVRLRLFVAPDGQEGQVNTLAYTLRFAKRVKQVELKLLLDFHYSDGWADPTHQNIPAAWKGLSHSQLLERVFVYTRETLAAFRREGVMPNMVEVGNEITNGMLWPDAGPLMEPARWNVTERPPASADAKWDNLAGLLKVGIRGVRESDPTGEAKVMIHIDKGGNKEMARWFFDNLQHRDVVFDVIGLSYYPFWHGTLDGLKDNLSILSQAYKKDIMVVETGYDTWRGPQGKLPFPLTPEGQKAFLEELIRIVAATHGGRGQGVCYWAPEWIMGKKWNGPTWSGQWEDRALFDYSGNMRPAMEAFQIPVTGNPQQ
jgi:arabinogalactan endo-1,4-beta-galactosidase